MGLSYRGSCHKHLHWNGLEDPIWIDSKESRNGTFEDSIYNKQLFGGDLHLKEQNEMAIYVENEGQDIYLSRRGGKWHVSVLIKKKMLHSLERGISQGIKISDSSF